MPTLIALSGVCVTSAVALTAAPVSSAQTSWRSRQTEIRRQPKGELRHENQHHQRKEQDGEILHHRSRDVAHFGSGHGAGGEKAQSDRRSEESEPHSNDHNGTEMERMHAKLLRNRREQRPEDDQRRRT